jgi:MFS family permease
VFRFWRDLGYAVGALLTGVLADMFGIYYAMLVVGAITILSALVIEYRMSCGKENSPIHQKALKVITPFPHKH